MVSATEGAGPYASAVALPPTEPYDSLLLVVVLLHGILVHPPRDAPVLLVLLLLVSSPPLLPPLLCLGLGLLGGLAPLDPGLQRGLPLRPRGAKLLQRLVALRLLATSHVERQEQQHHAAPFIHSCRPAAPLVAAARPGHSPHTAGSTARTGCYRPHAAPRTAPAPPSPC